MHIDKLFLEFEKRYIDLSETNAILWMQNSNKVFRKMILDNLKFDKIIFVLLKEVNQIEGDTEKFSKWLTSYAIIVNSDFSIDSIS